MIIKKGQIWKLLVSCIGGKLVMSEFTIDRVDGSHAHGTLQSGKSYSVRLVTLRRRARSARLVDGSLKPGKTCKLTQLDDPERPPPRAFKLKGLASNDPRYTEALRMQREDGKTLSEIAAVYGKTVGTISGWLSRARDAEQDANLGLGDHR